uniref:Uncharacterized protein n=1 Tax=Panagrolaimus superbus TaxID=310955 RepID=A0A914XZK0_9BILA
MFPFNQLTFSMVYRFEYSPKNACAVKESLDKCMDKSVVKRCFNADDLQMIEFVNDLTVVEKITLTYFEMDYICGDVYQAVLENINCTNIHSTKQYNASKQNHFCDIESVTNFIAYEHFHACSESYRPILKKITAFSNCFSKRVCHFCDNLIKESLANLPDFQQLRKFEPFKCFRFNRCFPFD